MQLPGGLIDGKYQLVEVAGEGGMATVYKAVQKGAAGFQRAVAIKHIKPEYRALKNYIDMFIEEARVGSELQHPNIVQVHDFIIQEGSYYLVMEWVDGVDLGTFIRHHRDAGLPVPWPLAVAIAIGTLRGLAAAHGRIGADGQPSPVVHRDVTPHNILLGINGAVKLSDFGLARARDRVASLTAPGTVKGKLSYLAPEVSYGKTATLQSDVFGVGNVLWETLAAERLFDGKNDVEIFKKIRACEVPAITTRRRDVPAALANVLDGALAVDPAHRFTNATAFAQALSVVMKQAVGIDPGTALGQAVRDVRASVRASGAGSANPRPPSNSDGLSTDAHPMIEASYSPTLAGRPQHQPARPSLDIEFSQADMDVEPIELTPKKK